ncbi:unnamed protein product [Triticum turgidum subsp. durum]|uniref:BSD domain-containing protein n=1 Tax=Triticum turgidum subsp. durum TaxID=4567 RepID=A0A9R1QEV5_TRITD|nr:unnamed protein product [Triticum turgidum subsp. durum]
MDNFFNSVFSAAAAGEHEEEEGEEEEREVEQAAERDGGGDSGGGWSFGGLMKTLAEEIEGQREEQDEGGQGGMAAADEVQGEEGGGSGGGWSFAGLIKTLAEDLPPRDEQEAAEDEDDELEAEAPEEEAGEEGVSGGGWSFGGLMKTFSSRSESVLEGYRRDLQDLGSGLRVETTALRAAAARAAAALPGALEAGASVASDRLESVGQAVDDLGAAAAGLLSHANEALRSVDADGEDATGDGSSQLSESASGASWRSSLPSKKYFFAVDKLRQAEDVRTKLVSRAMLKEDEEELSWEVDDDDDDNQGDYKQGTVTIPDKKEEQIGESVSHEAQVEGKQEVEANEKNAAEDKEMILVAPKDNNGESSGEASTPKSSNGTGQEEKTEAGDSCKESDLSLVSRPSLQEEDLSWEEIEDVGDQDEKKAGSPRSSPSSKVEDIRKRLNSVQDDEDLSWDVDE